MRKIVIPTDFSETSINAIEYALELFKYEKCEFIIMNAFADEVYENTMEMCKEDFEEFKDAYQRNVDKTLQKEIATMLGRSPNPKHTYTYEARFGTLVDETNHIVDRDNIDIVIMGTKGGTNDNNITFGSNTLQVIKYVQCPVLAVPVSYHGATPKNILFPTDYMLPFKRRELKLLSTLAKGFVATIHMLFITEFNGLSHRQQNNKSYVHSCFEDNETSFLKTPGKDITKGVNKVLRENDFDMLVMVNQRHSYLENILYRSTIEKIGIEINIPFLVLQNLYR
ncbi:universal stress protein [Rasiella sp. SM2506]|uniref:universal stress protein n=1 Tax=Rasiella sp. SM2506 TaxID=3423914 RepID=UPI003D795A67